MPHDCQMSVRIAGNGRHGSMEQRLVAAASAEAENHVCLGRSAPVDAEVASAVGVVCKADQHASLAVFSARKLADVQFAALAPSGCAGASTAMGIMRPNGTFSGPPSDGDR